jgi:uncharacterized protein YcaQ
MSRATEPCSMTKAEARRIWLRAQRLDTSEPFGAGPQAVAAAVDHLGYVQIDTISVIERCHHHILFTRIPAYRRADLRQAQSSDKTVFEYWTHALSYVPVQDFRYFVPAMRRGFVIMEINRQPVRSAADFGRLVAAARTGDALAFYGYDPSVGQKGFVLATVDSR